jgi:hypothetical protein
MFVCNNPNCQVKYCEIGIMKTSHKLFEVSKLIFSINPTNLFQKTEIFLLIKQTA